MNSDLFLYALKYWPVAVIFIYFYVVNNIRDLITPYLGQNMGLLALFGLKNDLKRAENGEIWRKFMCESTYHFCSDLILTMKQIIIIQY